MILHPIVYVCTSAIKCRMAFPIEADCPNCSTPMQKVVVAVPQILKVFSRVFIYFHKKIVLDFLTLSISHSVSLDMLNNFCFHV